MVVLLEPNLKSLKDAIQLVERPESGAACLNVALDEKKNYLTQETDSHMQKLEPGDFYFGMSPMRLPYLFLYSDMIL